VDQVFESLTVFQRNLRNRLLFVRCNEDAKPTWPFGVIHKKCVASKGLRIERHASRQKGECSARLETDAFLFLSFANLSRVVELCAVATLVPVFRGWSETKNL
jgi:hypothetical protein